MGRQGLIHSTNLFNFSLAHFEHPEFELPNKLEITSCNGISLKKNRCHVHTCYRAIFYIS